MATGLTIQGLQRLVTADQVLPLTPPLVQVGVGVHVQGQPITVKDLAPMVGTMEAPDPQ